MKKFIVAYLILLYFDTYAITQIQANSIVNTYIAGLGLPSNYLLYSYGLKSANSTINTIAYNNIVSTPNNTCFMYFVDEAPFANWGHSCRYIFVNSNTGNISNISYNYPPKDLDVATKLKFLSGVPVGNKFNFSNVLKIGGSPDKCYAVIISGGASKGSNWIRYWNDCQAMYNVLTKVYGYKKSNIYCLISDGTNPAADRALYNGSYDNSPIDLDGDGINDVAYDATKSSISTVFNILKNKLNKNDFLYIFSTDHGSQISGDVVLNLWNDQITATQFGAEVDKVNAGHIATTMEQCFSGGFIPKLCKQNRTISTACMSNELSYAKGPDYTYNEYVYHWISAVGKKNPNGSPVNADFNGDGKISFSEAFVYSKNNDLAVETPQYCSQGNPNGIDIDLLGDLVEYTYTTQLNACTPLNVFNLTNTTIKNYNNCVINSKNTKIQGSTTTFNATLESNLFENFEVTGGNFEIKGP